MDELLVHSHSKQNYFSDKADLVAPHTKMVYIQQEVNVYLTTDDEVK